MALRTVLRAFATATGGLAPELPETGAQARARPEGGRADERWTASPAAIRLIEPGHAAPRPITTDQARAMLRAVAARDAVPMEEARHLAILHAAYAIADPGSGIRLPRLEFTAEAEPVMGKTGSPVAVSSQAALEGLAIAALLTASGHPALSRRPKPWASTPAQMRQVCHVLTRMPESATARAAMAAAGAESQADLLEEIIGDRTGRRL